jgi:hypothetical protein
MPAGRMLYTRVRFRQLENEKRGWTIARKKVVGPCEPTRERSRGSSFAMEYGPAGPTYVGREELKRE